MSHKLIVQWYAKWNNLISLLIYSALMLFFIDYWLQFLPWLFENFSFATKRLIFYQLGFLLVSSFFVCGFFDRSVQEEISTLYRWISIIIGITLSFFFGPAFIFYSIVFSFSFGNNSFKLLKKENAFHWFFLMTPVVFLLMVGKAGENSKLDFYFFAQPYELLQRWLEVLYIGWLIAAFFTYLFDAAIAHSKLREYKNYEKELVLSGKWKVIARFFKGTRLLDMETFKQGIRPQAWVMQILEPTKPWRLKSRGEILCSSYLYEVDCSDKSYRFLDDQYFVGYGLREIDKIGEFKHEEKFEIPRQESVLEKDIHAICEENKTSGESFYHQK